MKYYYAIITFDTKQAADAIYSEYDGYEFEKTSMKLNLAFVPPKMKFT